MFDFEVDGVLQSKVYIQRTSTNWNDSVTSCLDRGMRLFQMTSPGAVAALAAGATAYFGLGKGSQLWVDGLNPPACQKIRNTELSFETAPSPCNALMYCFCELVMIERGLYDLCAHDEM